MEDAGEILLSGQVEVQVYALSPKPQARARARARATQPDKPEQLSVQVLRSPQSASLKGLLFPPALHPARPCPALPCSSTLLHSTPLHSLHPAATITITITITYHASLLLLPLLHLLHLHFQLHLESLDTSSPLLTTIQPTSVEINISISRSCLLFHKLCPPYVCWNLNQFPASFTPRLKPSIHSRLEVPACIVPALCYFPETTPIHQSLFAITSVHRYGSTLS
ncbi:hypothetical protein VTL71DRAFT_2317 [Oculimacula yallundae]|uniref:Uncharacterized protein n=1 Tax=Oculimacula yallundae TaxID=86028 RepID=A0ABR4C9V4_9HELO